MKLTYIYVQYFLVNESIVDKFIENSSITSHDSIYEIGTGNGILTKHLCEKAKSVVSSEIDSNLYNSSLTKFSLVLFFLRKWERTASIYRKKIKTQITYQVKIRRAGVLTLGGSVNRLTLAIY